MTTASGPLPSSTLSDREPVVTAAGLTSAVLFVATLCGWQVTSDNAILIGGVAYQVLHWAAAFLLRSKVTSPATLQAKQWIDLHWPEIQSKVTLLEQQLQNQPPTTSTIQLGEAVAGQLIQQMVRLDPADVELVTTRVVEALQAASDRASTAPPQLAHRRPSPGPQTA